jgi:hypothetical protein
MGRHRLSAIREADAMAAISISKSEYYSSLPWFPRCLAMLNWRPVVDYELRAIEFERRKIEFENRRIAHEQRMKQLQSEIEQLQHENQRLAELDAKLAAIGSPCSPNTATERLTPPHGVDPRRTLTCPAPTAPCNQNGCKMVALILLNQCDGQDPHA